MYLIHARAYGTHFNVSHVANDLDSIYLNNVESVMSQCLAFFLASLCTRFYHRQQFHRQIFRTDFAIITLSW